MLTYSFQVKAMGSNPLTRTDRKKSSEVLASREWKEQSRISMSQFPRQVCDRRQPPTYPEQWSHTNSRANIRALTTGVYMLVDNHKCISGMLWTRVDLRLAERMGERARSRQTHDWDKYQARAHSRAHSTEARTRTTQIGDRPRRANARKTPPSDL